MRVSVFYSPEQVPVGPLPDCALAIDVLRATTTLSAALDAGAGSVRVFSKVEDLLKAREGLQNVLTLGERGGDKIDDFDLGNSPLELRRAMLEGKTIFMTTTNGTRSLERVRDVPCLLAASLVNLGSILAFLRRKNFESLWIVCSGWEGAYSLEDAFCAGAILDAFDDFGNDEAIAAVALFRQWKDRPLQLLRSASHGKRLLRRGLDDDLAYCARLGSLDVLPVQREPGVFVREKKS